MDSEEKGIEALGKIKKILDKYKINYWLDEGTLLGAVREKKLIEWDHDIDIAAWYKDLPKIIPLFKEIEKKGVEVCYLEGKKHIKLLGIGYEIDINLYHLKNGKATRIWHVPTKRGRILDYLIWTIYLKNPENRNFSSPLLLTKILVKFSNKTPIWLNKKISKILFKAYEKKGCKFYRTAMPSHFFKELTTLEFYNMDFKVPKKTEEYLEYRYGKDWRTPKKDYVFYKDDQSLVKKREENS
jgi:phosphorylcholine metabolism protein LicD